MKSKFNDGYYHLIDDLEAYPDAWLYVVWSKRGPGKTYSCLWHSLSSNIPIIYLKRTIEDVNLITSSNDYGFDPSPYYPINRDHGTNVKSKKIRDGVGGFWRFDEEGNADGLPVAYVMSLNGAKKIKGFDLSRCDWMVLDEFIPQQGEIVRHAEGAMLLDLYMTVNRDRQKRGLPALKLILFANAEEISTPITNELDIIDYMADINNSGQTHLYIEDREILLHHITDDEVPITDAEKHGIFKGMQGTKWHDKAFGGSFANNDFSNVQRLSLKNMKPYIHLSTRMKDYYIYYSERGIYYMCSSRADCMFEFNLEKENDQKKFYTDYCIDLRNECIEGNMKFLKYSMYDLIMNYKKFYNV